MHTIAHKNKKSIKDTSTHKNIQTQKQTRIYKLKKHTKLQRTIELRNTNSKTQKDIIKQRTKHTISHKHK